MTKEEAIFTIENRHGIMDYGETEQLGEALDMAIAALKAEPCEDAVSRKAVEECKELMTDINGETVYAVRMSDTRKLPPVTPKQRMGKWIKYASPRCGEQHYKCTNCDDYVNFGEYGDYYTKDFKFCPHCGAKMEGESE